jgi:lambda repressor-like predicted transcriptional regulator
MKPNEIKAALMLNGKQAAEIARKLNLTRGHVSNVINGHTRNRRVEAEIAAAIGKRLDEVWPDRAA